MCRYRHHNLKMTRSNAKRKRRRSLPTVKEEPSKKSVCNSDVVVYSMVTITAVLSYVNSLNGEFVHDDIPAIVTNNDVKGVTTLKELFLNDFWGTPMVDVNSHKSYRPLTVLTFRLNHALAGLHLWWWHVCNVVLHAACCVLVARTCITVARLQRPFAILAALLFAVHPIHTEAVAGVVGRADVLACIFFLLSLLVYHRPSSNKNTSLSIVLGALSMLAKETGITILLLNLVLDFYKCWPLLKRTLSSLKTEKKSSGFLHRAMKVSLSLVLLIGLRLALLQGSMPTFSPQDNLAAFHESFAVRSMTFCYLAAFNWWLLLCPWTLSHDWQMSSIPLVTSVSDPRNLLTCAAIMGLLMLCYRCLVDAEAQRHIPAVIGVLLLVVPFIPASNLFLTVGFVIAERILYIPSIGSVIITAYGVQLMWSSKRGSKALLILGLTILTISGVVRTHMRNADWRDRPTLLRADLATLPQNAKLQYNYGNFLRETQQQQDAIKHYKEALRLWPSYASAYNNLGTLITEDETAAQYFVQAIKYNQYHVNAHYNLAKLYKKNGQTSEATKIFETCISLDPRFIQAYMELISMKTDGDKYSLLRKLVQLEPQYWENHVLYGNWLKGRGFLTLASKQYVEAFGIRLKSKKVNEETREDLVLLRLAALSYRATGQHFRILQLVTRWHTWRRGWYDPVTAQIYLKEWRLKMELKAKAELYAKASTKLSETTSCFDHSHLSVEPAKYLTETSSINNNPYSKLLGKSVNDEENFKQENSVCNKQKYETKKRTASINSQMKIAFNKSEIGLRDKKKPPNNKNEDNNVSPKNPRTLTEQIIFQTC